MVGNTQELLLLLDEYWELQPELQGIPIYQASGLARRALSVFQTYVEMMNDEIKQASMQVSGNESGAATLSVTYGDMMFDIDVYGFLYSFVEYDLLICA